MFNFKNRPQWKFIQGGSNTYIKKILDLNRFNYVLNTKINKVLRLNNQINLINNGKELKYDYLVIATHADQALAILDNATENEKKILSGFEYTKNKAYLHSDI